MDERSIAFLYTEHRIGMVEVSHLAEGKQRSMILDTLGNGYMAVVYFYSAEACSKFMANCKAKGYGVWPVKEEA